MIKKESRFTKVTISLPKKTLEEIELVRGRLDIDRSSAILQAVILWLEERHRQELEGQYVQGYKKFPEKAADVEGLYQAGLESFTPEEW